MIQIAFSYWVNGMNPFDLIKTFSTKEYSFEESLDEKEYASVIINKALSFSASTIHYSNFMNGAFDLPNKAQYDFYFHCLPKGVKTGRWKKAEDEENTDLITFVSEYFDINNQTAEKYISLMSVEQLETIRIKMNKGGRLCVK